MSRFLFDIRISRKKIENFEVFGDGHFLENVDIFFDILTCPTKSSIFSDSFAPKFEDL